ncbi:11079_t:CDS:1, partial [Gigaspora margarita]
TVEVPISNTSNNDLRAPELEHMDMESDSSNTFYKFIYEEEVLNEIEEYHTKESVAKEIGLYDNPWADIESPAIYLTAINNPPN